MMTMMHIAGEDGAVENFMCLLDEFFIFKAKAMQKEHSGRSRGLFQYRLDEAIVVSSIFVNVILLLIALFKSNCTLRPMSRYHRIGCVMSTTQS